ncbi:hypothetical protein B0F88_10129 [Methylobacter tundripaludum]|uniref:Uncharacterized protein n=1 Tax=Methylobacter tundripaludum TaxID=173365 RepID=A0A2S6H7T9_9GAMM|nr:hypothetical protein B0F88_10129 [Methylobacter tundripaludum]
MQEQLPSSIEKANTYTTHNNESVICQLREW